MVADDTKGDDKGDFVRITNREIWDEIRSLSNTVHSMDDRMNNILAENVALRERVRALELKTYTILASIGTGLLVGAGALAKALVGG